MIDTTAPRALRSGFAAVGIAGALALAGCAGTTADSSGNADTSSAGTDSSSTTTDSTSSTTDSSSTGSDAYVDGTYTAEGAYATPETVESISVTVTLKDDVITAVKVSGDPQAQQTVEYQSKFIGGISDAVVGKNIDQLSVSRVAGSSLTSGGFNEAIDAIKAEAAG